MSEKRGEKPLRERERERERVLIPWSPNTLEVFSLL